MFIQTGLTVFTAIFQLFIISLAAGFMYRRQWVSMSQVQALSSVTVNIFLPCLIVAKTIAQFRPESFELWWMLPLSGVVLVAAGLVFSGLLFRLKPDKRPLMTLASMQNGIYIVLPIGQILFSDQFDSFALYAFLLVLGLNPMMWSIGKVMISGGQNTRIRIKDFITPPLTAIFISVTAVFTHLYRVIPDSLVSAMDLLGQATVPAAVFVLGATMGSISLKKMPALGDIFIVAMVKFVLVPALAFGVLFWGGCNATMPLFCSMIMIQAASPPATNLILIVKRYGGDAQAVSAMMLILYILSIFAMPLWIAAWQVTAG